MSEEPVVVSTFNGEGEASQTPDLRGTLTAHRTESQSDQSRMFSAREAGVQVPPENPEPGEPLESEMREADAAAG